MAVIQSPYEAELDPFFHAAGIPARTFGLQSRIYEGTFEERPVKLVAGPRKRTRYAGEIRYSTYKGHKLDFTIGVAPHTRFVAAPIQAANTFSRKINRWYGLKLLATPTPELAHLEIWAIEPAWAGSWLAQPHVADSLARLLPNISNEHLRAVSLSPLGGLGFGLKAHIQNIKRTDLARWMNDLFILAQAADEAPPPLHRVTPSKIEVWLQEYPVAAAFVILGVLFGAVIAIGIVFVAVAIVLIAWLR